MMPVLPFIEDNEENITEIVRLAHENGARFIYAAFGVTLRMNQRDWYYSKLDELFPKKKELYIKEFGDTYSCQSPRAKQLSAAFREECRRYGLLYEMEDIISEYKRGYYDRQLSLF